jgi:nitroreductase
LETLCWSRVPASADVQAPARDIGLTRLVAHPGCIVKPQDLCTGWRRLSRRRRSSRSFRPDPLPRALVDRTVAGTQIPLPIDLTGEPADVRVTVHQVRNTGAAARERVVEACLGQEYLGDADTFVVFHASREATSPMHRSHARTEALVRAGGAAQLIYLSATALDVGVTAVGGFRPRDWAEMARVPADDDVLYLMALGSSGSSRTKVDRHAG